MESGAFGKNLLGRAKPLKRDPAFGTTFSQTTLLADHERTAGTRTANSTKKFIIWQIDAVKAQ